jgi:hypothetical protein
MIISKTFFKIMTLAFRFKIHLNITQCEVLSYNTLGNLLYGKDQKNPGLKFPDHYRIESYVCGWKLHTLSWLLVQTSNFYYYSAIAVIEKSLGKWPTLHFDIYFSYFPGDLFLIGSTDFLE